ncbi:uncharacterized protein I303_101476 [Kwoniella dejecticola CBS 10117]|uniref:Uncharacterized protein n=1 Tax=Kwoniella dejecticola CBS 10117 TaxID=1296121 RepID=A0A1A6ADM1_9TREE|nr:uncharacterized protein I303_02391 [Kwoniella dejecticola CBS 10117]OBR88171.1 hypothetical protein I303_02391 [Kwoniella dejecticola CBS 10117]
MSSSSRQQNQQSLQGQSQDSGDARVQFQSYIDKTSKKVVKRDIQLKSEYFGLGLGAASASMQNYAAVIPNPNPAQSTNLGAEVSQYQVTPGIQDRQVYLHSGLDSDLPPSSESFQEVIFPESYDITISAKYPSDAVRTGDRVTTSPWQTRVYHHVSPEKGSTIDRFLNK